MMIQTEKKYAYKGFGYYIQSEFQLPELFKANESDNQVDIVIERGDLTNIWGKLAKPDEYYVLEENRILFMVPGAAIFLIEEGKKIVVSPHEGADEGEIRLFTLGTCMGAVLMQRKVFPLHGSAIAINGKTYAIVGESGAGKSTLASAFTNKGFKLLTDDVIAVSFSKDHIPYVTPAYPQQKLWQESLSEFGMESEQFSPLYGRETKYSIPITNSFSNEVMPLAGIFELVKTDKESIDLQRITGLGQWHTLFLHTYRNLFLEPMGLIEWHFNQSTNIIRNLPLYQLCRPSSGFTAPELVDLILETVKEEC